VFASISYSASGLFVIALVRNRQLVSEHLSRIQEEQALRREAEEQLRLLVASSPATILTLDERGTVIAANGAAGSLFLIPEGASLVGRGILDYVPVLADALRLDHTGEEFRTSAQCQARRDNGEPFLADVWFSSYARKGGTRLAAIIVDASEEMREREEENLRQLQKSNRITAAAVSHELRNLCGAVSLLCAHLKDRHGLAQDDDFRSLENLVKGLGKLASVELQAHAEEHSGPTEVPLQRVLDDLHIVIAPDWKEIDGTIRWPAPKKLLTVAADYSGLLQVFLNLAQNSLRAVQNAEKRELEISVEVQNAWVRVRFRDTGPGVTFPERLFHVFQNGADGTGLGLYVSRAVVRTFGGELRYVPENSGSCFVIELLVA
jgi:signal transduction histidine kinase